MKSIICIATLNRTINSFLVPHIISLKNQGFKVDCGCNMDSPVDNRLIKNKINMFHIPLQRNPFSFKNLRAFNSIRELYKEHKYDLIYVHTPVAAFITRLALGKYKALKIIYMCHGFHFYKGASFINWLLYYPLERIAAHWTDCIITINEEDYRRAFSLKLRGNNIVKFNGAGLEVERFRAVKYGRKSYRKALDISEEDFVILIAAELNRNKNHIQIIKAIDIVARKYSNIKVFFAGRGKLERKLKKVVNSLKLNNNIIFLGWREDINELVNCSDVIGLFSKREGLGMCLLEGMSFAKPLLCTRTRGAVELVKDKENGFLVEVGDYRQTARCIENMYKNRDKLENMGKRSKELIEKYSMEKVLKALTEVFSKID